MGWSKWSCQFFFLQLILLPLSLELELHPIEEDSSCHCPRYQPAYPNLAVDQCYHLIQASFVQGFHQETIMGWSKWSCQFFFLLLLILLPLSLELELQLIGKDSSCQCPRYQPDYPNLPVDQCYYLIQSSFVQDREKVLAELQALIKKELIADLRAAIQPALQHLKKMIDYSPPENINNDDASHNNKAGPAPPARPGLDNDNNDNNDDGRHRSPNRGTVSTSVHTGSHLDPD